MKHLFVDRVGRVEALGSSECILDQIHRNFPLNFEQSSSSSKNPQQFSIPPGTTEHLTEHADRRKWKAMPFAKEYGLKLVGATYMLVRRPTE
jgi:hypothetical protein